MGYFILYKEITEWSKTAQPKQQ